MRAPPPVLGNAAPAPPAEPHGRPQAVDDLGQGLRDDLADRINWTWLQACVRFHWRLSQSRSAATFIMGQPVLACIHAPTIACH